MGDFKITSSSLAACVGGGWKEGEGGKIWI